MKLRAQAGIIGHNMPCIDLLLFDPSSVMCFYWSLRKRARGGYIAELSFAGIQAIRERDAPIPAAPTTDCADERPLRPGRGPGRCYVRQRFKENRCDNHDAHRAVGPDGRP
jgi:hypothetical protein